MEVIYFSKVTQSGKAMWSSNAQYLNSMSRETRAIGGRTKEMESKYL